MAPALTIDPDTAGEHDAGDRSLPASWYRSKAFYELERRAVFSKNWLLVTHKLRFEKPGTYLRYETAGFPFFLVLDREGRIRGFHNVCRHRAFPVVTQDSGTASILACKYHGWSYGLTGKLAKAPRFDTVPSFDKSKNGLFPVHTHIDGQGFVWVNLEASREPSRPWSDMFDGADTQPRLSAFNTQDYVFDHTWTMHGDYNWKTLADNYNECYHCGVAHPGIAAVADLNTYDVNTVKGQVQHLVEGKPGTEDELAVAATFLFPNVAVSMTPHYFYFMRVTPTSSTTTSMQYEVYRHKSATDEEFNSMDEFFKQVEKEDKDLCNAAQRNLNAGTYVAGKLHPHNEKGVLHFQKTLKQTVLKHGKEEDGTGKEIWPTAQVTNEDFDAELAKEVDFCSLVDCRSANPAVEW